MYTRVYEQTFQPAHTHHVPKSALLHYVTWTFPPSDTLVPFDNGQIYRISQTATGVSSMYPTVVRGGKLDGPWPDSNILASKLHLFNVAGCDSTADTTMDFEYEYLAWQETLSGAAHSRVRRRYFLMDREAGAQGPGDTMRIWSMNTVSHAYQSCSVPVVSLAAMRVDSQLFKLTGVDTLLYADPKYCRMQITGNISDTSIFCAFGLFNNAVNGPGIRGAVYWTAFHSGWPSTGPMVVQHPHRFAPFTGDTNNFMRMNNFSPGGAEISRDPGQWPHIAHRAFGVPLRREELRRVQEIDNTAHIMFSSEFFLKPPIEETIIDHHYAGFIHNGEEIAVRCEDAKGNTLQFRLDRDDRFTGAGEVLRQLSRPTVTLVSDPIEVGEDVELTLDNIGMLREGVELRCEDVSLKTYRAGRLDHE
ncbi:MAG: hypothetical protein SGJ05_07470 [bacterium]|nr:hypothetical protein [bacterium]